MKVLRKMTTKRINSVRSFSQNDIKPSPTTSKELLVEQMKQQRQLLQTIRQRTKLEAEERKARIKAIQEAQKLEKRENSDMMKRIVKAHKDSEPKDKVNVSLYKSKSSPVTPVSMNE